MKKYIEHFIFCTRWFLLPFYFGLIIVLGIYAFAFVKEIIELVHHGLYKSTAELMLKILEFVDVVMIANLVKMIVTGSYNSFISKDHGRKNENISSGTLKVKISTSLIGIVSINLLECIVNILKTNWDDLSKRLAITGAFILIAISLSFIDYLHVKSERLLHGENHH